MPRARKRSSSLAPGGLAGRALERWATALLGIQVARSLYARWRRMSAPERAPLEHLAIEVKERARDLHGEVDPESAGRELQDANERLTDAIIESAEADPEISAIEVQDLRADLARELERLAGAQIRVSRGPGQLADGAPSADGQA